MGPFLKYKELGNWILIRTRFVNILRKKKKNSLKKVEGSKIRLTKREKRIMNRMLHDELGCIY